ncbi:MAG TPA: S1/P1 nuclease [Chthoniobacteraceae bacterium]|jgi:hypothetical protein|nr:S1/P1 nuclease [Chthoniobacteraceae bacterium]
MAKFPALALLLLVWLSAGSALAWNKAGHMTTGAIAYRELKAADPAALAKVLAALRLHPQYAQYWQKQVEEMPGEDGEMMLFMLAARWPDDVRGRPEYHRDVWHYINYPYRPPATTTAKPEGDNVVDELEKNRGLVKTGADAGARAIALCWVMHLTGDVHQPLHVTALFNDAFPNGDRGGTAFFIKPEEGGTISLHSLWDGLVIGSDRFQAVRNTATELVNRPELARGKFKAELAETSVETWALKESFPLAIKEVYRDGTLKAGLSKGSGAPLPPGYLEQAKPVAERQLVLAGYRLAATLQRLMH